MKKIFLLVFVLFFANVGFALAQTGIIGNNFNYAWSNNIGWINFAPTDNNRNYLGLQVSDAIIVGSAWSQNLGWIIFNPKNGGVKNDEDGNLAGYAFGENIGWINFDGVNINCDGQFVGRAVGDTVGTINFDCKNCVVKTSWLPAQCEQKSHSECNRELKCISVVGKGDNQCLSDVDCSVAIPIDPENPENPENPEDSIPLVEKIKNGVLGTIEAIKNFIETPLVSLVTKIITTASLAIGALSALSLALFSNIPVMELFLSPVRIFGILMTLMGLKKRVLPWGVVYDSVTKQPLDPAYVILKDTLGKDVGTAITDLDGRYGFLVEPGLYKINSQKTNYVFPSQKLVGKVEDEAYNNLYFGGQLQIKRAGEVITKNIPLDPIKFDWNEFAKKDKKFMKFYSRWDSLLRKVSDASFLVGFFVAIVAFIFAPYPYNTIIFVLYLVVVLLRVLGIKPKALGYVVDKMTKDPLPFAILRIMMPTGNVEISHKITDKYGRYYCLVPKGKYQIKIEKKNSDGSYALVHTSEIIDASSRGIIKKKFEV